MLIEEVSINPTSLTANSCDPDELKRLTTQILDPNKELKDLIPQATALRDLFETRTNFRTDTGQDIGAGQTRLESGLAISPALAAMCIRELFRTLAFIRGLHEAINDAATSQRPVRVLYAGCGPYALLALPLMTVLPRERVTFTLLDIHAECLDKARALIDSFGLSHFVDEFVCADATRHQIPKDKLPGVIVSETMAVALHNEPQVTIARRLLAQAPAALMVPQSVSIEVCMINWSREHVFMPADFVGEFPEPDRDRIYLGKIFELDAANIKEWEGITGDTLPAGTVKIPLPLERKYKPYLLTNIAVYGKNHLKNYDCSLTVPQRLRGKIEAGDELQFYYQLGNNPQLNYEIVTTVSDQYAGK
ncbi:MAG: class I SAM-dependent methyltransferase [Sideroxydans sp.]|nr:class I SAM-dependent methyltransferase [Sideroxydans sp.]